MKALVTGGLGLIGSHIVMKLLERGHQVRVFDIRPLTEWPLSGGFPQDVEFYQGDVADLYDCHKAVKDCEVIFHTAAIARTAETIGEPLRAHAVNVTGTLNLLQIAKALGIKRFINSSSSIVYVGNTTPYAVSKRAAEDYVSLYEKLYGLSTISLRYANVYGEGQRRDGEYPNVLAAFARDKAAKGYITIFGDGSVKRDFVNVDDVADANMCALYQDVVGIYDIAFGEYHDVKSLAERFDCEIRYEPERPGDAPIIELDPFWAKNDLGFKAQIPLDNKSLKPYL